MIGSAQSTGGTALRLAPDDAVAVQSGPAELGFLPLTDAMIDLHATFASLMRCGLISPGERRALTGIARRHEFSRPNSPRGPHRGRTVGGRGRRLQKQNLFAKSIVMP